MRYGRDTALREDACRLRKGALPRVMAAFANLAISVLRVLGKKNVKRAMSTFRAASEHSRRGCLVGSAADSTAAWQEPHGGWRPRCGRARAPARRAVPDSAHRDPEAPIRHPAAPVDGCFRW